MFVFVEYLKGQYLWLTKIITKALPNQSPRNEAPETRANQVPFAAKSGDRSL
jgi:hypothetical protein